MSDEGLSADPLNLVVAGVGGQGNVLASRLLGRALMGQGYQVTIGETYGLSQRGGSVMSHVRVSRHQTPGPLIPRGQAHLVLGLEPMEIVRVLADYGNPHVVSVVNTRPAVPVVLSMTTGRYPDLDEVKKAIADLSGQAWFVEATEIALELGTPIVTNVVMAGALVGSGLLPVTAEAFEETIRKNVPARHVELNLKAFRAGLAAIERLLAAEGRTGS